MYPNYPNVLCSILTFMQSILQVDKQTENVRVASERNLSYYMIIFYQRKS